MKHPAVIMVAILVCVTSWSITASSVFQQDQHQSKEKVYKPNEVTVKAKITRKSEPRYTEEARQHQISGTVVLEMVLRATGKVTDIIVIEGLPYGLNESCINTAKAMKFDPALKDDQKVSQYLRVVYEFHLY